MAKKAAKKTTTNKSSQKKTAKSKSGKVKKAPTKKTVAKKKVTRSSKVKKPVVKKAAVKKTTPKKSALTKAAAKKQPVKKVAKKKVIPNKSNVKKTELKEKKITVKKKPIETNKESRKTSYSASKRKKQKTEDNQLISTAESRAEALKKIKGYSTKDLEHFRTIILEKRDEIIEQLQNLREQMLDPTTGEYINENSPYSLHMAEQGTDAMEREKTFLYAQRENKFLGYLEDALKRIDLGTYGICVECIEEPQHLCDTCPLIPKARLEAVPHSQLCLPMKQKQEKK
ncbi:MAG: conjugal transfer protein TraR [Ignavibacteriaceae bacterium]